MQLIVLTSQKYGDLDQAFKQSEERLTQKDKVMFVFCLFVCFCPFVIRLLMSQLRSMKTKQRVMGSRICGVFWDNIISFSVSYCDWFHMC